MVQTIQYTQAKVILRNLQNRLTILNQLMDGRVITDREYFDSAFLTTVEAVLELERLRKQKGGIDISE